MPAGSKPVWRGSRPSSPAASTPATSTTTRDASSARPATPRAPAPRPPRNHPRPCCRPGARRPWWPIRPMTLLAESFFQAHEDAFTALLALVISAVLIFLVDRLIKRQGRQMRSRLGIELDPVTDTRLRFIRRVVEASIAVIGVAVAISQFAALDRLATSILASSALAAAVIGFAARQTLANAVAGVLLFITQPVRIGDLVTVEDGTGTVEDVRLTYTWLRAADAPR